MTKTISVRKQLIDFAWPAFIAAIFSELYFITNSMIVGNYVSLDALSAVSACSWICNIFNFTFYGLGMGAGILTAKYIGANNEKELKKSLDTSIVFAVVGGVILTIISELSLPILMKLINIGPDIYDMSLQYLRVYLLGTTAVLTYNMCFFILRSFGDTKHQLYYSIISSIVNLSLGLLLVRVFHMNAVGTAIATAISQFVMDILALRKMFTYNEKLHFDIKNISFSFKTIGEICSLGIPAGIQNMLIAISSMAIQSYVNEFPNEIIAGVGVAEKVSCWAQLTSVAVSAGTMAMVSRYVGAREFDKAREVIKESLILGTISTVICVVLIFAFSYPLVGLFNDNVETIKAGGFMTRILVLSFIILNLSHVYNGACRGAGNVKWPMYIAIGGQVICKYLFVAIGLRIVYSPYVLYCASAFGYSMAGIFAFIYFNTSKWVKENQLR